MTFTFEIEYDYSEFIRGYNRREAVRSKTEPRFEELSADEIELMASEDDPVTADIIRNAYKFLNHK